MSSLLSWKLRKNTASSKPCKQHILFYEGGNAYDEISQLGCKQEDVNSERKLRRICGGFGYSFRNHFFVFCWLRKRGAALELNKDHAALMLMEILYKRGLVNKETLEAAREKLKKATDSPKAA
jgi:hypothetical protein